MQKIINDINAIVNTVAGANLTAVERQLITDGIVMTLHRNGFFEIKRPDQSFNVYMDRLGDVGPSPKIDALKRIREEMGVGLKDAKDRLDALLQDGIPVLLKSNVSDIDALNIKRYFADGGHEVRIEVA